MVSLFVSGNDVYVAGNTTDWDTYEEIAAIWKNGVMQLLDRSQKSISEIAWDVFVYDGDVYAAGEETDEDWNSVAKVWKNGVQQYYLDGSAGFNPVKMFVFNGDVYVARDVWNREMGKYVITIWENGAVHQHLFDESLSEIWAKSIFVSDKQAEILRL
jgi:sulfur transfer complex TusBCD TusB component (DsrH family)